MPPPALQEAMGAFVARSLKAGTLVDTGGLAASKAGKRIRIKDRKLVVTDGPFSESKEVIGGWAILEAPSMDEAMRIGMEFMQLHIDHWPEFEGESEVRPIEFKLKP
jgi:hypothetical protein